MRKQEHVVLVNPQGELIGTQEKYSAHTSDTPLHLAFSCWIFNTSGKCLVTRRAMSKKAWPGVWTNSVCGHPQIGESNEEAIIRRCRYELGIEIEQITAIAPDFRYREIDASGIVENEICPVFAACSLSSLEINYQEVIEYQWVDLENMLCALEKTPWAFSPWMVHEAAIAKTPLRQFAARIQQ